MNAFGLKNSSHVHLAAIGVCLVITLVAYAAVVRPPLQAHAEAAALSAEAAVRAEKEQELERTVAGLNADINSTRAACESSPVRLQPASRVNSRVADLTSLATSCGLELQNLKPGAAVASGRRYQIVSIGISGTGSYRSCAAFLSRTHETFRDMAIVSIRLAASPATIPAGGNTAFQFDLEWFVQPAGVADAGKK